MYRPLTLAAGAAIIAMTAPASAAVIIYDSPGEVQPEENVLFQAEDQFGTTVQGVTNQTSTNVTFTSDEMLTARQSAGQARVEGTDGSLDSLMISLTDPLLSFTEFELNLFNALQGTGQVTFTLSSGLVETYDLGNGQNFFGIRATDGDRLTSVAFQTDGTGVQDARQFRIGGISSSSVGAVPEPGTWAMLLFGFGAIGAFMRGQKRTRRIRLTYA